MKIINKTFFGDARFSKLTERQAWITLVSALATNYAINGVTDGHAGTGIFKMNICEIPKITKEDFEEEFGVYDIENNIITKPGLMPKNVMEYDYKHQTVYNKSLFKHSGLHYLTTPDKVIQGIARDFFKNKPGHNCPTDWWAEFAYENSSLIHDNFHSYRGLRANNQIRFKESVDVDLALERLFQLESGFEIMLNNKNVDK